MTRLAMTFRTFFQSLALTFTLGSVPAIAQVNLPSLGDASSAIVSPEQEYQTGQYFLRAFHRQAPVSDDPLLYTYLQSLIRQMIYHSPLPQKRFNLIVVDSTSFNAFAVPGNVIGINTGLLSFADSEDQLSSVVAHEIAHLSQRHYARTLERQKQQSLVSLATMLGSLLILAAGGADAGLAALTASQAAAISNRLKYSRLDEQEADRIGMQILYESGMNPTAAANMFQHMLVSLRYRTDVREYDFLLTHPLTDARVADAFNQARSYPAKNDRDSFDFHLMKARIYFLESNNPKLAARHFKEEMIQAKFPKASEYGQGISLLAAEKTADAAKIIDKLYLDSPHRPAFILAKADLLQAQDKTNESITLLRQHLKISPGNFAISMALAEKLIDNHQPKASSDVLKGILRAGYNEVPSVWFLLAETEGLSGNVAGVHLARAEFYIRIGAFVQAQRHLNLALPLLDDNVQASTRAHLRIKQVEALKQASPF